MTARGEFIFATDLDIIIFCCAEAAPGARAALSTVLMCRIDRHDVASSFSDNATLGELLTFREGYMLRVFARGRTSIVRKWGRALEELDIVAREAGVRVWRLMVLDSAVG